MSSQGSPIGLPQLQSSIIEILDTTAEERTLDSEPELDNTLRSIHSLSSSFEADDLSDDDFNRTFSPNLLLEQSQDDISIPSKTRKTKPKLKSLDDSILQNETKQPFNRYLETSMSERSTSKNQKNSTWGYQSYTNHEKNREFDQTDSLLKSDPVNPASSRPKLKARKRRRRKSSKNQDESDQNGTSFQNAGNRQNIQNRQNVQNRQNIQNQQNTHDNQNSQNQKYTQNLKNTQNHQNNQTAQIDQYRKNHQNTRKSSNTEPTAPTKRKTQETTNETQQTPLEKRCKTLRPIIIDGMNVAIEYGKYSSQHKTFDCLGLQKAYEYFQNKNHEVSIILPARAQINSNTEIRKTNFHLLDALLKKDKDSIIYATQRRLGVNGPWIKQHDDFLLFDIEKEIMPGGIIVSKDYFRDHWDDAVRKGDDYWLKVIEQQILPYNFVKGKFFLSRDPMGAVYDRNRMRNNSLHPKSKNDKNNNDNKNKSPSSQRMTLEDFLKF